MSEATQTTSAPISAPARSSSSIAASSKFATFAVVFAIAGPVLYVLCDFLGLPLFTYHPATGRFEWGYALPRRGEGPVMYWYGWTATTLIGSTVLGFLATLLPANATRNIPLFLVWLLPILAVPPLVYSLMSFWTK
jgi:hypothetical protein